MIDTITTTNGRTAELQNGQLNERQPSKWQEIGTSGLEAFSGFITQAYHAELYWPAVYPLYNRLRRSDPEISIVRQFYSAMARQVNIEVVEPDKASSKEGKLAELYQSELENMDGGIRGFLDQHLGNVPFMGWGWWEVVPGVRSKSWRPPGDDRWESEADDGLTGIRRLAWRDQSSFDSWDLTDETGRLKGMWQSDYPNPRTLLPLDRSLHITFGDTINPEGLTPLEAVWRLERIKYGLEVVMGIGFEHAAGYLDVRKTTDGPLSPDDKSNIRAAARSILSAQEGNYAAWPFGFEGDVKDIPFSAAANILEACRYYGLLKLQLYNMDWVAIASTAGTGAYSARADASSTFMMAFNAMIAGAIDQYDSQVGKRLYQWNAGSFAGARRPKYVAKPLDKIVNLGELAQFWQIISQTMPVGEQDFIEIRTRSGILPETPPEPEEEATMPDGTKTTPTAGQPGTPENVNTKGLNGAQITAVLDVLAKMASGEINRVVALELLIAVGIDAARAKRIVSQDVDIKPEPDTAEKEGDTPEPTEEDEGELQAYTHPRYRLPDSISLSEFVEFIDGLCIPAMSHSATSVYYDEDGKLRQAVLELAQERKVSNMAEVTGMLMLADRRKKDLLFMGEGELSELASRPFAVGKGELPDDIGFEAVVTEADINRAIRKAAAANPLLGELLKAKVINDDDSQPA